MDERTYIEFVITHVYERTMQDKLKWKIDQRSLVAEPTPLVRVDIHFKDKGPGSAEWERIYITYPVGRGMALLDNPARRSLSSIDVVVSDETLIKITSLFKRLLLEPRSRQFDNALAELARI